MHGPGPGEPHPDGGHLAGPGPGRVDPHAGVAVHPARVEPQAGQHVDEHLLQPPDVGGGVGHPAAPLAGDSEDRVADELAGTVVGDFAAPVGLHHLGPQGLHVGQQVPPLPPPAQGHHVGVLQQQQVVVAGAAVEPPLQGQGVAVADPPQPADAQGGGGRADQRTSASQSRVSMISLTRCRKAAA